MSRFWRIILFSVFAIGFLITAPLVVLYTAGYRYQFGSMRVVKSGIVSITTIPKGASVFLDSVLSDKKTPAIIDNILPGNIHVRVEKTGYSSWQKTLPVVSNQSTFVPNAILFLNGNPTQSIDAVNVITSKLFNASRFSYLVHNKGVAEVWVKDASSSQNRIIFKQSFHPKSTYTLSWSPDGGYVLLKETANKEISTLIRIYDSSLIQLPTQNSMNVHFDLGSAHTLLYNAGSELRAFGIDTDVNIPKKLIANDIQTKNSSLLAVQSNQQSTLSYLDEKGVASIVAYLPLGDYQFKEAPSPYILLEDTERHHLVLLDLNQKNPFLLNEEVSFFEWSPKQDRLVYSNGFDINVFSLSANQSETITRFSEPLTALAWYPLGDEILYARENTLHVLELDRRDERNEVKLVDGYHIQSIWTHKDGASIFFMGQKGSDPATIFERVVQK